MNTPVVPGADGIGMWDAAAAATSFAVTTAIGDTLGSMGSITAGKDDKTYQTMQHLWQVSIQDKRNDLARQFDSSSPKKLIDYKNQFPDTFKSMLEAFKVDELSAEDIREERERILKLDPDSQRDALERLDKEAINREKLNNTIDEIIRLQFRAKALGKGGTFYDEETREKIEYEDKFYLLGKKILEASKDEDFKGTKFQKMAGYFIKHQNGEFFPGDITISNLHHFMVKKAEMSAFFNSVEKLPVEFKDGMALKAEEILALKLIAKPKNYDATLAAVQWEMNLIEGVNYGYLAYSTALAEYITPEESAQGVYSVKPKVADDASQVSWYDPKQEEKDIQDIRDNIRKNAKEKGIELSKEDWELFEDKLEHVRKVRKLAMNVLIQDKTGANAGWRSNQANSQIMNAQGQKPHSLSVGQVILKGATERLEVSMTKFIENINLIEKDNPEKQGERSPWAKQYTPIKDKKGNQIGSEILPTDLFRDGEIYNDAHEFYDLALDRTDKNTKSDFFKFDYVNAAMDRMIVDEKGYLDEIMRKVLSGDSDLITELIEKVKEQGEWGFRKSVTLKDDNGKKYYTELTYAGYKTYDETLLDIIEAQNEGASLSFDYKKQLVNDLKDQIKKGDPHSIKQLMSARPEALSDITADLYRKEVDLEKSKIISDIRKNPEKEVNIAGRDTTYLKQMSKHLDITKDKTQNDVMLLANMAGGQFTEHTGGDVRSYKQSLGALFKLFKAALVTEARQLTESFAKLPKGNYEEGLKIEPENDLNEQFTYALLSAIVPAPIKTIKKKLEGIVQRQDVIEELRPRRPEKATSSIVQKVEPRPDPDTREVNFATAAMAWYQINSHTLSKFRSSADAVKETVGGYLNIFKPAEGSATKIVSDYIDRSLQRNAFAKPAKWLLGAATSLTTFTLGGGLANWGMKKLTELGENKHIFDGFTSLQALATGGLAAGAAAGIYSVGKASWEIGKSIHNRAGGFITTPVIPPLVAYIGTKIVAKYEVMETLASNKINLPFSEGMVGTAVGFMTAAGIIESAKYIGKKVGEKAQTGFGEDSLLTKVVGKNSTLITGVKKGSKLDIKNLPTRLRNILGGAAIGAILALGMTGESAAEIKQDKVDRKAEEIEQVKTERLEQKKEELEVLPEDKKVSVAGVTITNADEAVKNYLNNIEFDNQEVYDGRYGENIAKGRPFLVQIGDGELNLVTPEQEIYGGIDEGSQVIRDKDGELVYIKTTGKEYDLTLNEGGADEMGIPTALKAKEGKLKTENPTPELQELLQSKIVKMAELEQGRGN